MVESRRVLSVSQAAALCGVGRTTVGYWVRSRKLYARRAGRSFEIPVADLLHFLASEGHPIPPELENGGGQLPAFGTFRPCWEYWEEDPSGHRCARCVVHERRIADCFSLRPSGAAACPGSCRDCRYFRAMVAVRLQFIHQIAAPAAVFKGLTLWGGNAAWAELCGLPAERLTGLGLETILHPRSLAVLVGLLKKAEAGLSPGSFPEPLCIVTPAGGERPVAAALYPLREPEGATLWLAGRPGGGG